MRAWTTAEFRVIVFLALLLIAGGVSLLISAATSPG